MAATSYAFPARRAAPALAALLGTLALTAPTTDAALRGRKRHNVFAIQPLTGSNPIDLSSSSDVRGRICSITVDEQPWTRFTLRRR